MESNHQFLNTVKFFPQWIVRFLFLGTFNPEGGALLDYYYRRPANGFWRILKAYFDPSDMYPIHTYEELVAFMQTFGIGCVDIIRSVEFPDEYAPQIFGQGYSDATLFTVNGFTRTYNFEEIQNYITNQPVKPFVCSTWGNRLGPSEFLHARNGFQQYCNVNNIEFTPLSSPSGRVYRGAMVQEINDNWHNSLDMCLQVH
jgi:hypothetical protein